MDNSITKRYNSINKSGNSVKIFFLLGFLILTNFSSFSQSISSPTINIAASGTLCAGSTISFTYVTVGAYTAGNIFTIQLSNPGGSFATSPVNLGTVAATQATATTTVTRTGTYATPFGSANSSLYRVRVISSNPSINGTDNGYGFTINAPTTALTTTFTSVCQNENVTISLSKTCNFATGNTFSFQLSDASGSFASPTTLATYTSTSAGNYTVNIPSGTPAGSNYQIQAVSSNTNTPNSVTPTFSVNAPSGTPGVYGNGAWNVYCYNGLNNFTGSNYQGWYTENNLSFTTTSRLGNNNVLSPCLADGTSGNAYAGCPFPGTQYSVSYMRTGIPCGLYQINLPSYDDYVYLYINGVQTYSAPYTGTGATNIWTGFIGPTTNVELRYSNNGGPGNLAANFIPLSPLSISTQPATICSGSSMTINAVNTNTVAVNYAWAPAASSSPATGSLTITATPTTSTVYTVSGTDAAVTNNTGCSITSTVNITVNPVPTTTVSATLPPVVNTYTPTAICYGTNTATLTAGGAYTYTWSPAAGLNTTSGYSVVANPSVTTSYTVSGSNNCTTVNASTVVTVQVEPTSPSTVTPGNNIWNAFCYSDNNWTSYYGYYTETSLNFDTRTRWNSNNGPSTCTTTTGGSLAYSGCSFGGTVWTMWFRRTGIPCGYYQIDIPGHDDNTFLFINGVQVWSHVGCCDAHVNVWSGFIGPSTVVEFKQYNGSGPGYLAANFTTSTYPVLSPPATICSTTSTTLTANNISGANYVWTDGSGGSTLSTTTGTTTVGSPTVNTTYTCTVTDPVTTCSASASVLITVSPLPTTAVTPTSGTISCAVNTFTLTATGANTYTWSPSAGLSASTGNSVIATPTTTTIYTVSGSNNCATVTATSTIAVVPLITPTVYPTGQWNAYCYGDQTFTNYYGYYTEIGSGASTYDFTTTTRWTSATSGTITPSPGKANNTNGNAYLGCVIPNTNFAISFKRTGFACGTYSVNFNVDDAYYLYVNGLLVAERTASGSTLGAWVGSLCSTSQVEIRYVQSTGTASLTATFIPVNTATTTTQNTWMGGTSTDWFTASNWCGGNGSVPSSSNDVVISASGAQYLPVINASGAQCKSILISGATASVTATSTTLTAIPAATLTIGGGNNLDVYGNWFNRGSFAAGTGSVTFNGATAATMSCTSTELFYNLTINNSGGITMSSGTNQVSNLMTFNTGVVTQNATLQILNGASVSGANNSSYVDGFMVKYGNSAFTFPVGTGNLYRPIAMSAPVNATDNFTAKYFYANPYLAYPTATWDPYLDHLSGCEYWILNRTGGSSNVNVTLSWNTNSCGVTNLPSLIVARWDAGLNAWKNHGNGGTTGNTTTGTIITSAPVTNFSPFTLASTSSTTNPLPIELLYFTASAVNNTTDLTWATATETDNKYFTIERSKDGVSFEYFKEVSTEAVNGNSTTMLHYKTYDVSPYSGVNYYRLKQTDINGKFTYSDIAKVAFDKQSFVSIFPNPATSTVYINVSTDYDNAALKFVDALGREILSQKISSSNINSINTSNLNAGMYYVIIDNGNGLNKTKITIQK